MESEWKCYFMKYSITTEGKMPINRRKLQQNKIINASLYPLIRNQSDHRNLQYPVLNIFTFFEWCSGVCFLKQCFGPQRLYFSEKMV